MGVISSFDNSGNIITAAPQQALQTAQQAVQVLSGSQPTQSPVASPSSADNKAAAAASDSMRAVLSALNPDKIYAGLLAPLAASNGLVFPYSPTISFQQAVTYMDLQLVHSNTDYAAYTRTPSVTLSVGGKFTVQNQTEGRYAMAAIHFLRTASKSHFGETDAEHAGLPPPVLQFSAYGSYMYNKLRVILKSHSWSYEDGMDTVIVKLDGGTVRLPIMFTLQTELTVVQTPDRMRTKFNFDRFASGELLQDGGFV